MSAQYNGPGHGHKWFSEKQLRHINRADDDLLDNDYGPISRSRLPSSSNHPAFSITDTQLMVMGRERRRELAGIGFAGGSGCASRAEDNGLQQLS
jgi:hypothetical protein